MDLHIIPGVTAKAAAEAHRQDLVIQKKYDCNCMTYWVDEEKGRAFCLIEAPSAEAVKKLHKNAHGLMPHKIIEVNDTVVESFLGRIYDPETPQTLEDQLKVFNDPAFRVLVLIQTTDPLFVIDELEKKERGNLFTQFNKRIKEKSIEFEGKIAEQDENISIISFTSAFNAIGCSMSLFDALSSSEMESLGLKISVNAGMPVTETKNERVFGETIEFAKQMFYLDHPHRVTVASIIKEITNTNYFKEHSNIFSLSAADETVLRQLMDILEENCGDETFNNDTFCKAMSVSKSSLNRTTQSLTGRSPNALLREYRLNKSLQILKKEKTSISQIAYSVGFGSPSYFSKCFKTHFGISPTTYTARLKD
jgi:AraC-like DNA-binding protein